MTDTIDQRRMGERQRRQVEPERGLLGGGVVVDQDVGVGGLLEDGGEVGRVVGRAQDLLAAVGVVVQALRGGRRSVAPSPSSGSPPGGSMRTTRAPSQDSTCAVQGAATQRPVSTTRTPVSGRNGASVSMLVTRLRSTSESVR